MTNSVIVVSRLIIVLCLLVKPATGQNRVTATGSANYMELANLIFRPDVTGVTINSAVFTGDVQQLGNYTATGTLFNGLPRSGVVMSSGRVVDVKQGSDPNWYFGLSGDGDLTNELKRIGLTGIDTDTFDAAVLVVDVSVQKAMDINIAFVFGSREYGYALSQQSADVFGLFHGGTNIALIGNDPVSVKSINCQTNKNCKNNTNQLGTSLSRYTTTQVATLKLPEGQNQKVKIAVADCRDPMADAVVFLSFWSFQPWNGPKHRLLRVQR
jgi:hypothetical protein